MAVKTVGLAASLTSLLQISGTIITTGYGYLSKVVQAPSRMRMVLSEVSSVNLVLGRLEENFAHQSTLGNTSVLHTLFRNGVFEDCKELLKKIDGTVRVCMAESEAHFTKRETKALVKRVIWPMKEKETEEVLGQLDRLRSVLSDAITQDSAASLHRLENATQRLHQTTDIIASSQLHAELIAWVSPYHCDPVNNYSAALKRRQPGTGSWLTESEGFRLWSEHDHGIFWLRGLPGCGKTVLTSTVIEHLQHSLMYNYERAALAYFYIDYRDPAKQNLDACLGTLVRQMIDQDPQGMKQLRELKEQKQRSFSRNLTASEYISIIKVLAEMQTKVYIVIDALDEAPDPEIFVDALRQLLDNEGGTPIAVLVSSRNDTNLENLLTPIATRHVMVSNEENDDVQLFISTEVNKRFNYGTLKVPNVELIDLTISKLVTRADGLFLQASLLLDFVFAGKTSRSIRKALMELPNGLEETYETILRRTTSQNQRHINEIRRSLQWLSMSFVPLTPAMLVEAAAIDPDDTYLDAEACMEDDDLIGMLSSLVLVDRKHTPSVVSLAHQTVFEYLQSQRMLQSDMSRYHIDPVATHQYLAETSIQYLLFPDSAHSLMQAAIFRPTQTAMQTNYHDPYDTASALVCAPHSSFLQQHNEMHYGPPSRPCAAKQDVINIGPCLTHASQKQALLNYVANLWPEHLKSGKCTVDAFKASVSRKLEWYLFPRQGDGFLYTAWEAFQRSRLSSSLYFVGPFHTSDQQKLFRQLLKPSYFACIGHETTQNPFFYTILYGLDHCFDLLRTHYYMDMIFRGGWTPLTVAAASGAFSIAKKLLEAGASVDKAADMREGNGLTPLHIAAELAMENLVELFLAHGASINSLTATKTTPFYRAARGGSTKILQSLHDAGSDVNAPSWDNYNPLMEVVSWSNLDALELLLAWGADPYSRNLDGKSALDMAFEIGDRGVLEILSTAISKNTPKSVGPSNNSIQGRED